MTKWDSYSDQPFQLINKKLKLSLRLSNKLDLIINALTIFFLTPLILIKFYFTKPLKRQKSKAQLKSFFGMGITLDKDTQLKHTKQFIDELQVKQLLIRIPLSDIDNIKSYKAFAKQFNNCHIVFNLMQDRSIIKDQAKARKALDKAFDSLQDLSKFFSNWQCY